MLDKAFRDQNPFPEKAPIPHRVCTAHDAPEFVCLSRNDCNSDFPLKTKLSAPSTKFPKDIHSHTNLAAPSVAPDDALSFVRAFPFYLDVFSLASLLYSSVFFHLAHTVEFFVPAFYAFSFSEFSTPSKCPVWKPALVRSPPMPWGLLLLAPVVA